VPNTHLIVAGQGLAGEEREFARLITERGLSARVHLVGWTKASELPNVFAAADLAIYLLDDTRLNRAKCPMKLVDLLLAGVPVVADSVGQAREYVRNGITSALVRSGDVDAMADCAIELLRDRERRQAMGDSARDDVLTNWSWSMQGELIDRVLRESVAELLRA
jgi:glycosyltransferase involved in cell wall biosynthesis